MSIFLPIQYGKKARHFSLSVDSTPDTAIDPYFKILRGNKILLLLPFVEKEIIDLNHLGSINLSTVCM